MVARTPQLYLIIKVLRPTNVSLRSCGDRVVARSVRKDLMMIKNSEPADSN